MGIQNVLNTGCPTMWRLTPEYCATIPTQKAKNVVFTLSGQPKYQNMKCDQQLIDITNAFCTTIDAAGYYPMIYSYKNFFTSKLSIVGWDKWVAQRAYEMNSKAITTTDEMMQTANNLKR